MAKGYQITYLVLLGLFSYSKLHCQNHSIEFEQINLGQGLSQGSIYTMLQDRYGYMWFGTQDGLNKYDGYQFTVYRHDKSDTSSLSDNFINAVYEDHDKKYLWIGTLSGGLNRFERQTNLFRSFQVVNNDSTSISSNTVLCIYQQNSGILWVGTDNGLNKTRRNQDEDLTFEHFLHHTSNPTSISNDIITCILEDNEQSLWVGTQYGLNRYDPNTNSFQQFFIYPDSGVSKYNHISALYKDDQNNLFVGTLGGGLFRCPLRVGNPIAPEFIPITFKDIHRHEVSAISQDYEKNIWIGFQEEGLVRWDQQTNEYIQLRSNPLRPKSLSNDRVSALYFDKFGNNWVGTLNGINRVNLTNRKFTFYQNRPGYSEAIHNSVFAIAKDDTGAIWTGTRGGLFCLGAGKKAEAYLHKRNVGTSEDAIRSLFIDNDKNLWVGTEKGTLEIVNRISKSFTTWTVDPSVRENAVYVIRQDNKNIFWLGTYNGLYSMDPTGHQFKYYDWQKTINTNTRSKEIRSIEIDKDNNLWIGTRGAGLFHFNVKTQTFQHFAHNPDDQHSISSNVVASIYIGNNNTVWLGTSTGLNKFHNGKFFNYTERDGLPNDVVYGILPDDKGYLWLSTNQGISRFDPLSNSFRNYDTSDGLQSQEFNAGGYHRSADGEFFFGGINGYNSFYPERIKDNTLLPEIVLTAFKVFNEPFTLDRALEYVNQIDLTFKDYVFSFEFSAIHLTAPEKNQYAYMLEGFDPGWVYTKRSFATYTNLNPGTYTFRVKASNNDGIWNEKGMSIQIRIAPPFWQTTWFYGLITFVIGLLIYSLYRLRVREIQKEERLKTEFNKKLAEVEMTALRAQMNPHFLFNCLNSINRYIVRNDPETASNYLTKFSRLIRHILENSKSQTITLKTELEALKLYIEMEEVRFENRFDCVIWVDKDIEVENIEVPPLLLQPYAENAIWHGLMHKESKGILKVEIKKENELLKCIIEDNGIGRKKAMELKSKSATRNKSMGMKITTDRLSLYQEHTSVEITDLIDLNGEAGGTRVLLTLPYTVEFKQSVTI